MEETYKYQCPFCGEISDSFFDLSEGSTSYIEDCQVCCQPILLRFSVHMDGSFSVQAERS
ncbi:MAG: CPXCG motif-containing cysteine-rich protein [Pseudobacteriovorax sp.]|nr:CPXCG motif-containing cysteine-rich protein [Pseudobacteriovorax sp.]